LRNKTERGKKQRRLGEIPMPLWAQGTAGAKTRWQGDVPLCEARRSMTEETARRTAKVLARGMGITFYVVRSRYGRFLAVQVPSDDCQILATVTPPKSAQDRLAA
jgi:hypothetical protein